MYEYVKTKVYDTMMVDSIITVLTADLRELKYSSESHDFPEIIYIADGYSDLYLDGILTPLIKGQLIIVPPNTIHGGINSNPDFGTAVHTIISFESASPMLKALYNCAITLTDAQIDQYLKIIQHGMNLFEIFPNKNNRVGMQLKKNVLPFELEILKKHLELFLIDLYSSNIVNGEYKNQQELSLLTDFLNTNITKKISVDEMANYICISPGLLRKRIHKYYGCGPHQHFINLKIHEAKRLIRLGKMNFTEISEYLGFESIHYFSRQFKLRVGKSPREYLNDIKNA